MEEVYDLARDPLELTNALPRVPATVLARLRAAYDRRLDQWRREGVPYHGYQPFGLVFDRTLTWAEKMARLGTDSSSSSTR